MQQVEKDGVYVPENMSHNTKTPYVFAMNNLDWKMKTLEGSSFNATSANVIENPENQRTEAEVQLPLPASDRKKNPT